MQRSASLRLPSLLTGLRIAVRILLRSSERNRQMAQGNKNSVAYLRTSSRTNVGQDKEAINGGLRRSRFTQSGRLSTQTTGVS